MSGSGSLRHPAPTGGDTTLPSLVASWRWAPALAIVALVGRLVAVAGMRLYRYFDSAEYDRLDFSGRWRRPWTTPLFYSVLPDADAWTVLAQAVIGAACWLALAFSLAAWMRDRRARFGVAAAVVALSLTTSVTNWDATRLSESTAISLTVLVLAAWLELVRRTSWRTVAAVLIVTWPWLFVRQSMMPTAWAAAAVAVAIAVAAAVAARRQEGGGVRPVVPLVVLAIGLLVANGIATASYGRNTEIAETNLTAVISGRIGPDPDRLAWFVDAGMPLPASGATDFGSLDADPAFRAWRHEDGTATYARFLIAHPWFAATGPLEDMFSEVPSYQEVPPIADDPRIPTPAMLSPGEGYGSARQILPGPVEEVLFGRGDTGGIVTIAFVVAVWGIHRAVTRRPRRPDRRVRIAWTLFGISAIGLWATWHGSVNELARLAIVPALTVRVAAILALGALAEGVLADRDAVESSDGDRAYPRPG